MSPQSAQSPSIPAFDGGASAALGPLEVANGNDFPQEGVGGELQQILVGKVARREDVDISTFTEECHLIELNP